MPESAQPKGHRACSAHAICVIAAALLSGCGGGGGGIGSTPPPVSPPPVTPPPVTPPPPPPPSSTGPVIIPGATTTQQFVTVGAAYNTPLASYSQIDVSDPNLASVGQLDIRYDAASQRYEIRLPTGSSWSPIHQTASDGAPGEVQWVLYRADDPFDFGLYHYRLPTTLQYSALLQWFTDARSGYSAVGVATPPGAVPVTGSASYAGAILGSSTETTFDGWEALWMPALITGNINLAFNFGSGSLSGNISPMVNGQPLPSLSFANTVYSVGSTNFSGSFGTALSGVNSFSGRFTGPGAQEVIGNFAFPYASLQSGSTEQAAGAFVGRRP